MITAVFLLNIMEIGLPPVQKKKKRDPNLNFQRSIVVTNLGPVAA